MRKTKKAPSLADIVDDALPRSRLKVDRRALSARLLGEIEKWQALAPEVGPYYDRVRSVSRIAEKLDKQLDAAAAALLRLDVERDIKNAIERNRALGITGPGQPLGGTSVALDLYLIAWQAADGIRQWERVHRPGRGRPPATSAALTSRLRDVCKTAGMSRLDFDDVLSALSGQRGLPTLTTDTLKKRRGRARNRMRPQETK
ncbi:MAG: hypothetical protein M0038_19885 [Pseudomonadota bacterium]|jgi:hypothetical protein|nr:hypothetical protein [Pseudomonadota bacterium]